MLWNGYVWLWVSQLLVLDRNAQRRDTTSAAHQSSMLCFPAVILLVHICLLTHKVLHYLLERLFLLETELS